MITRSQQTRSKRILISPLVDEPRRQSKNVNKPRNQAVENEAKKTPAKRQRSTGIASTAKEHPKEKSSGLRTRTRSMGDHLDKTKQAEATWHSPPKTRSFRRQGNEDDFKGLSRCLQCGSFKPIDNLTQCPSCGSAFHFSCLNFQTKTLLYLKENPDAWCCSRCITCDECEEYIAEPANLQCAICVRAWHVNCLPKKQQPAADECPYDQWICKSCSLTLKPTTHSILKTPPPSTSNALPREEESTRQESSRVHQTNRILRSNANASEHQTHAQDDADDEEEEVVPERRQTRSSAIAAATLATPRKVNVKRCDKSKGKSRNRLCITDELEDIEASNERRGLVKRIKREMDEEMDEGEAEGSRKRAEGEEQSASTSNLYAEQLRVLHEMGLNPEKSINRNTHNRWLQFGRYVRFRPIYESVYPEPIQTAPVIYVCEFCLTPMAQIDHFASHIMFCPRQYPPGNEIYRSTNKEWNIWEVEGNIETSYCRNLCLMSKLFLSSKTLYHEVETFTFYILTEIKPRGCVIVGYFSKEKNPSKNNNLSCLLTMPHTQGKGYGKLLIDLSYKLSKLEHKIGSPEHPLSDPGLLAYRSYWRSVIFCALRQRRHTQNISIRELSIETAIHSNDIMSTLLANEMVKFRDNAYYIDINKALNANLAVLRRRQIHLEKLRWLPPFEPNPYSKMNSYVVSD